MRTQLLKARAQVEHLQDPEEELWLQLHPVCRCGLLVELRRGRGQNYHHRCREGGLCAKWSSTTVVAAGCRTSAVRRYEYCVEAHGANGPTMRREDCDEHGERVDHYD